MKLVVALALSANAFSPATPGGAKPREKVIPTSSAANRTRRKILISTQVTLTDCCATTSAEGQAGATGGTFGMFSDPMTADDFVAKL